MNISNERISQFKALCKEKYNTEISDEQALGWIKSLVAITKITYREIKNKKYEINRT